MVNIVTAGIGYGVKEQFGGYSVLQPSSLSDFREQLASTGVKIRDVVGYVLFNVDNPRNVTMMIQPQDLKQGDSDTNRGDVANLWPAGGKVDKLYTDLADKGDISIEQAYAAGAFVGEIDEFDGPHNVVVKVLNRAYGLENQNTLTSPDTEILFVNGRFVRHFERNERGTITQFGDYPEDFSKYDPLTKIIVSYSMGIDPRDTKDSQLMVTSVANLWVPASCEEIREIEGYVAKSKTDSILRMEEIDLTTFGSKNPTTVANMVASSLYLNNFTALTGLERPDNLPQASDIKGFENAVNHSGETIEKIVQRGDWQF